LFVNDERLLMISDFVYRYLLLILSIYYKLFTIYLSVQSFMNCVVWWLSSFDFC